jgi:hypothetical protein
MDDALPPKHVARVTYEGRYVVIQVPRDWQVEHGLPAPSPRDQWFETFHEFHRAFGGPWDHRPIRRDRWRPKVADAPAPVRPTPTRLTRGDVKTG